MGLVSLKRNVMVERLSWSGDSSGITTIGKQFRILQLNMVFRVTATGDRATISNDAYVYTDSPGGTLYDTMLSRTDNSGGATDNVFGEDDLKECLLPVGYEIKIVCNVGTLNTAYCEVFYEIGG